jgi:hypothetical protein
MAVSTFLGGVAGIIYEWTYAATKLPFFTDRSGKNECYICMQKRS